VRVKDVLTPSDEVVEKSMRIKDIGRSGLNSGLVKDCTRKD